MWGCPNYFFHMKSHEDHPGFPSLIRNFRAAELRFGWLRGIRSSYDKADGDGGAAVSEEMVDDLLVKNW